VVVVLNEHGGWGAESAAPAASKVVEAWYQLKTQKPADTVTASVTAPAVR